MKPAATICALLAAMLCGPVAAADVEQGIRLLRQARAALERDDPGAALTLLDQAYVELPFSAEEDLVYHGRADAFAAEGRYDEALVEYGKALHKPNAYRARFNSGVLQHRMAEQALEAAGVPLDPAAIPAEADPAPLIEAIEKNIPLLEQARLQIMEALRLSPDAAGRESVTALTERRTSRTMRVTSRMSRKRATKSRTSRPRTSRSPSRTSSSNRLPTRASPSRRPSPVRN